MDTKEKYEKEYANGRNAAREEHEPGLLDTIMDLTIAGATAGMSEVLKSGPLDNKSEAFKQGYVDEKTKS